MAKWDDEQLEQLLKQAPHVEDNRSKEEVLRRLKEEGVLKPKAKRASYKSYAVVAAMLAVMLGGALFLSQLSPTFEESSMTDQASESLEKVEEQPGANTEVESELMMSRDFAGPPRFALYEQDIGEAQVVHRALTNGALVVPVTFLVEPQLANGVELHVDASALHFTEVLPFVPQRASYEITNYAGRTYFVPRTQQAFTQAFEALTPLAGVEWTMTESDIVTVTFAEPLDFTAHDAVEAMQMIESVLLTAASFERVVRFENVVQQEWGGFDFTNTLPKPIGANVLPTDYILE